MLPTALSVRTERWPIAGAFAIARGAKTEAELVIAELRNGPYRGRGEAVPYARFGESVAAAVSALEAMRGPIAAGLSREALREAMPPGAARNALDSALLDLEAKMTGRPVYEILGLPRPCAVITAFTLSLDSPEAMGRAAARAAERPLLKLKLGATDPVGCVRAVREAAPAARLIVDANEAWSLALLQAIAPELKALGVALIEQPLPAASDEALEGYDSPVPLCADESLKSGAELMRVARRYDAINIKLDKTGGLTEAVYLLAQAREAGLGVMVGCMVATSLAMAPAFLLAAKADFVDLDGPLLLARDRPEGFQFTGSLMAPPDPRLWG